MPNRLADATSPYLLQHKDNPVDWWEWSEDAFDEAKARDVPVLLSVGYAACHWCHVMAHESFEDPETAGLMNREFVNVKVDREERPDVDSIYMEAVQAMTGRGGWPMTVWMTPEGEPFFAGTYFPKDPHHGMASFTQVIDALVTAWTTQRDQVEAQADQLVAAVSGQIPSGNLPSRAGLDKAIGRILGQFDPTFGGFGGAPKFPQQPVLEFLLRSRPFSADIDKVLETTLHRMADGGIHDHLAGGFARYSVDREWLVPHFEKMLYDNAQLGRIYLWAGVELGIDRFIEVARSTLDYLANDMRHPEGGFYSAEDADSEGEEGTFYVWSLDEFDEILGEDAHGAAEFYGVTMEGNFEGKNVLSLQPDNPEPAHLERINRRLLEARSKRERPGLDDKVVAAWNGLAMRAFAEAGAALGEQTYIDAAVGCARFVEENMIAGGMLMRSWREGRVSGTGFLDDVAAVALGFFTVYQATEDRHWLDAALALTKGLDRFTRPDGGFFSSAEDSESLIKRPIDLTDNPSPSGNGLAAEALLITSLFTGDLEARDRSADAIAAAGAIASQYPSMVGHHLAVATSLERGTKELAVVGSDRAQLSDVFWSRYRPHVVLAGGQDGDTDIPLLAGRAPGPDGSAVAYVCQNFVCNLPTKSSSELAEQLGTAPEHQDESGG